MAYTFAAGYGDNILPVGQHVVSVFLPGTTTLASLYTDASKGVAAVNPVTTDAYGNIVFYTDPGAYDLSSGATTIRVFLAADPREVSFSDATTSAKGVVKLAGDLAGTAASPTVPGLATNATAISNEVTRATAAEALKAPLVSPALTGTPTVNGQPFSATTGPRQSVRVAATANVTVSSPGATVDGVTMVSGDRVLLAAQTAGAENGIYVFNGSASAMTRATDSDTSAKLVGAFVFVNEGTQKQAGWELSTLAPFTVGTTALAWVQFSQPILDAAPPDIFWPPSIVLTTPLHTVTSAANPTQYLVRAHRVVIPKTGRLRDLAVFNGATVAGNLMVGVYDTGDTTGNVRTLLYGSASVAQGAANGWQIVADPNLAVTRGQMVDLAFVSDSATALYGKPASLPTGLALFPTGFAQAPGGSTTKISWSNPQASLTLPASFSEASANVNTSPYTMMARIS